jgi:hypothetical protein
MEQRHATLLSGRHQAKHFVYNFPLLYYTKYPNDNILMWSKLVPPLNTLLC